MSPKLLLILPLLALLGAGCSKPFQPLSLRDEIAPVKKEEPPVLTEKPMVKKDYCGLRVVSLKEEREYGRRRIFTLKIGGTYDGTTVSSTIIFGENGNLKDRVLEEVEAICIGLKYDRSLKELVPKINSIIKD